MENDDGVSLESGERSPLLDKSQSSRHFEDNGSEEIDERYEPQSVTSISKASPIILAFSFLEGIAFNGIGINLVLYLGSVLHWPISYANIHNHNTFSSVDLFHNLASQL
ncbi:uncharacterized protein LOC122043660 [Zingiber officinale]|uniref:uncharacterized protein LOC122043660 n=1 Tax=Zingiber officinale TaxID=94328 RepID=UPI001C4D8A54|nr:uncharacterized protein LOC122043660 [Zingiber officinale]